MAFAFVLLVVVGLGVLYLTRRGSLTQGSSSGGNANWLYSDTGASPSFVDSPGDSGCSDAGTADPGCDGGDGGGGGD